MSAHLCLQCRAAYVLFDGLCESCQSANQRRHRNAEQERRRRARNPEHVREVERASKKRRRERDPEEWNRAQRERRKRRKTRDPAGYAALQKRRQEKQRKLRAEDPERFRNYHRKWRARNREKTVLYYLNQRYGLSPEDRNIRIAAQGGRCAICRTTDPGARGWHLDHDHAFEMKDVAGHRALLCRSCNLMLGLIHDSPKTLLRAVRYLLRWRRVLRERKVDRVA